MQMFSALGEYNIILRLTAEESRNLAPLLESTFEEGRKLGLHVPPVATGLFEELATSETEKEIEFPFNYTEILVLFLDGVSIQMENDGLDTSTVENNIDLLEKWCADNSVLH